MSKKDIKDNVTYFQPEQMEEVKEVPSNDGVTSYYGDKPEEEKKFDFPVGRLLVKVLKKGETWLHCESLLYGAKYKPAKYLVRTKRGFTEHILINGEYRLTVNIVAELNRENDNPEVAFWLRDYRKYNGK